ncbi:hypothetical protein COCSUDRAFT_40439 [Coccomyxa subellipsoidea C-169]|uniref:FAD-binding PCMH-type domain-containing protein n=1 Tax=Coccomyxa subellipsoidea (strain C-169) TaxID=574566 RepID=I0Z382_COCSC|nr:hypothetical protein COCSUDRAFT_40439 [Coccomyxa subellipsoidea C-169]EIE25101.1 hypothetical protein COCSUDRAFT_40439 [Coccomyxa subellipsoidea C-169]|eukprot:XP_005649645.1 hypothetical protein COCSUDRAFT_40439 [Coccomyxa subellipsoidea C-169]
MRGMVCVLRQATVVAGLCLALATLGDPVEAVTCRQGPLAASKYCTLPEGLGNFQGYYRCADSVALGKPTNKSELTEIIGRYKRVKGVGVGHRQAYRPLPSWWQQQFCAGDGADAVGIVTTEMTNTLPQIVNPTYAKQSDAVFPIQVNEEARTVRVQSGITQRILLDYLANYTTAKAPYGYVLPAFAWYVDQTVGGAVSTGTHGSTMFWGSLSSQAVRIELALANGTLLVLTPDSNPHLWKAGQLAVGRLGIITEIDFKIVPQRLLTRKVVPQTFDAFLEWTLAAQDRYKEAVAGGSEAAISASLAEVDMTQLFWFVPLNQTILITYNSSDIPRQFVGGKQPATAMGPSVMAQSTTGRRLLQSELPFCISSPYYHYRKMQPKAGIFRNAALKGELSEGVYAQAPSPTLGPNIAITQNPVAFNFLYKAAMSGIFQNGTLTERQAILNENEFINKQTSDTDPYDQYEVSVPLQIAGDCLKKASPPMFPDSIPIEQHRHDDSFCEKHETHEVGDAVIAENLGPGFAVPPLIRFVNGEEAYLANTNGGPRMFFNIEDHLSMVMGIFRQECGARMHWGKAGWPRWAACFDGAKEFPDTWCSFGCAVRELDPTGKFRSMSDVWTWNAADRNGTTVPLDDCCTPDGFKAECTCMHRPPCSA